MTRNWGNRDNTNIIQEVYPEAVIDSIDTEDIRDLLAQFTLDKCKLVLMAPGLLTEQCNVELPKAISVQKVEEWFLTKYQLFKKPSASELAASFDEDERKSSIGLFTKPAKNEFVPQDFTIIAKERKTHNETPKLITLQDKEECKIAHRLYHLTDHMYLKPKTVIDIILRIA